MGARPILLVWNKKYMKTKFIFYLISTVLFVRIGLSQKPHSKELPYEKFKKQDDQFFTKISKLNKVVIKDINTPSGNAKFTLYKGDEKDEFGVVDAILSINNFYFSINLGEDYTLDIKDIAGKDNSPEIVIYTGCLMDIDGCGQILYVIRIVSTNCITITDFGEISFIASEKINIKENGDLLSTQFMSFDSKSKYSQAKFLRDLKDNKKQGKFILQSLDVDYEYVILESFELSANGFRKSTFYKKIKKDISQ
jgi:hypothetical protein